MAKQANEQVFFFDYQIECVNHIFQLQKKKRLLAAKDKLEKWKSSEEASNDLLGVVKSKLQTPERPKSVDTAGRSLFAAVEIGFSQLLYFSALRRRQAKDLEFARIRAEKIESVQQKKTQREQVVREAAQAATIAVVGKEAPQSRLLASTKASESQSLSYEALDQADHRRKSAGAHASHMALSGRDLQYSGRATPQWVRAAKGNYQNYSYGNVIKGHDKIKERSSENKVVNFIQQCSILC